MDGAPLPPMILSFTEVAAIFPSPLFSHGGTPRCVGGSGQENLEQAPVRVVEMQSEQWRGRKPTALQGGALTTTYLHGLAGPDDPQYVQDSQ